MSVFKSEFSRALKVISSNNCVIPSPNLLISSTATGQDTNLLIDTTANFIINGTNGTQYRVNTGDVVYNYVTQEAATIVKVINNNTLLLNANSIVLTGIAYSIYQQGGQTGLGNRGCFLWANTSGEVNGLTAGGDLVSVYITGGTICPIQFISSSGSSSISILALW